MSSRITTDLESPQLLRLLKLEAQNNRIAMKEVIIRALESYFFHRLETKALEHLSEQVFTEWNDKRDAEYDKI